VTGTNSSTKGRRSGSQRKRSTGPPFAYPPEVIRAARQRAHLRQWELADRVGASRRVVSRWETHGIRTRSLYLGAVEEILGLGDRADDRPTEPAPTRPGPRPAPASLDEFTNTELLFALAARIASLEAGRATPPPLRGDRYRWNASDAPSRRSPVRRSTPTVSQSDLA
jgi:hypothetical protein